MFDQHLLSFLVSFTSTVLGGLTLGFLFFLAREKVFPLPSVTGHWHMEMRFRASPKQSTSGIFVPTSPSVSRRWIASQVETLFQRHLFTP